MNNKNVTISPKNIKSTRNIALINNSASPQEVYNGLLKRISDAQDTSLDLYRNYGDRYIEISDEIRNLKKEFESLVKNYNKTKAKAAISKIEILYSEIASKRSEINKEWKEYKKSLGIKDKPQKKKS